MCRVEFQGAREPIRGRLFFRAGESAVEFKFKKIIWPWFNEFAFHVDTIPRIDSIKAAVNFQLDFPPTMQGEQADTMQREIAGECLAFAGNVPAQELQKIGGGFVVFARDNRERGISKVRFRVSDE